MPSIIKPKKKNAYDYFKPINATNIVDMAEQTGLDMIATKVELGLKHPMSGEPIESDSKRAIINLNTGEFLSVMSADYGLIQYVQGLDFTEVLVQKGVASYVSGDVLDGGKQGFVVMKTSDFISFGTGQPDVECYFYVSASHDGTNTLKIKTTPVVRASNIVLSSGVEHEISIKHTKHAQDRLAKAKNSVAKIQETWNNFNSTFKLLSNISLTPQVQKDYLNLLMNEVGSDAGKVRQENVKSEMLKTYARSPACKFPSTNGKLLGLYLAVCEYYEYFLTIKERKHMDVATARLMNQLNGNAAKKKARAYAAALDMQEKMSGFSFIKNTA